MEQKINSILWYRVCQRRVDIHTEANLDFFLLPHLTVYVYTLNATYATALS